MEEMARLREASDLLWQQAEENKKETRRGKIAAALASTKSAAGKRTVRFIFVLSSPKLFLPGQEAH